MSAKRTVVVVRSTRSPRTAWTERRHTSDAIEILRGNDFVSITAPVGIALVRACGLFALRVTIANGRAILELASCVNGTPVGWRACRGQYGTEPWQVAHEALELLATLDIDTPVRWG